MERPNILYLHSHDTGRFIQPYGHAIPTPNLQRLAEEGTLFRQAFCAAPTCSPSRASLLTGQAAHSTGMLGLAHRGFSMHDYNQHLLHTLRDAGYHSTLIGMQHIAKEPETIGYDQVLEVPGKEVDAVAPVATRFLQEPPRQPFFASIGFFETHRPFPSPGPAEDPRFTLPPAVLPDHADVREDMAAYKASARLLDDGIGQVLDALEASGLAENTLVICTTDHGIPFPDMKCTLSDQGIGVMLMMRGPGGFSGGHVSDALVSHLDIFPTICDLLAIEPPPWLQGQSMMPLVRGEVEAINDAIFAEVTYHAAYDPKRAVRTHRYKYIRRYDRNTRVLPNTDDGPTKDLLVRHGWDQQVLPEEQLYDLLLDPLERRNLVADPTMGGALHTMRERLRRWMVTTGDPLLNGPVAPPSGAEINDPDGDSPDEPTRRVS